MTSVTTVHMPEGTRYPHPVCRADYEVEDPQLADSLEEVTCRECARDAIRALIPAITTYELTEIAHTAQEDDLVDQVKAVRIFGEGR